MRAISSPVTIRRASSADASADVPRHELVVAGQDLHGDAVALELREDVGDIGQDRVGEADEAGQHQIGLVGRASRQARGSSQR